MACEAKRLDIGTRQKIRLRVTIPLLANTQLYPVSAQSFSHRSYVGRNAERCEQCDPFEVAYKLTRVFKIEQGNHLSIGRQLRWALGKLLVVMMRPQINHPRGAGNISSSLQSSSAQHELSLSSTGSHSGPSLELYPPGTPSGLQSKRRVNNEQCCPFKRTKSLFDCRTHERGHSTMAGYRAQRASALITMHCSRGIHM